MACANCDGKVGRDLLFTCDDCEKKICKNCAKISSTEAKVLLLLKERVLKFHCQTCVKFQTYPLLKSIIEDKQKLIEGKEKIIQLLEKQIAELKTKAEEKAQNSYTNSYANIVKKSTEPIDRNFPSLIITPKNPQDLKKTEDEIKRKIKPNELKVSVKNIKATNKGSIVIKCLNKADVSTLDSKKTWIAVMK